MPHPDEPAAIELRAFELATAAEDDLAALAVLHDALRREVDPDDAPVTVAEVRGALVGLAAVREIAVDGVWARSGARIVGEALTFAPVDTDNPHLLQVELRVAPDARRRGIGTRLAHWVLGVARRRGRSLVIGGTSGVVPGAEDFARALGAREGMRFRTNELDLSAHEQRLFAPDGLVARWCAEGPGRAPDYELFWLPHPVPEAERAALADAKSAMNDAPRGDLQVEDRRYTAQSIADMDAYAAARGDEAWTLVARPRAGGAYAGFTDLYWNAKNPHLAFQGDTAVLPAHRGHALGKWLKAAMLARLRSERPQVRRIRTGNADTNAAMLAINDALGFAVTRVGTAWQVETDALAERLGAMEATD